MRLFKLKKKKEITNQQLQVYESLQTDLLTHYCDEKHQYLLETLWTCLNPSSVSFKRKSEQWVQLGFQNHDPSIDIRGGGKLALDAMVFFSTHYRTRVLEILSDDYYSFAISCVNLIVLLAQKVHLCPTEDTTKINYDVFGDKNQFYQLFSKACCLLHENYRSNNRTEMEFNPILHSTVRELLASKSIKVEEKTILVERTLDKWSDHEYDLYQQILLQTDRKRNVVEKRKSYGTLKKKDLTFLLQECQTPPVQHKKKFWQQIFNTNSGK